MTPELIDFFQEFDKSKHFKSKVNWAEISELNGSDFLWEVLEPISTMIKDQKYELTRAKRLSPSQKALHFFWYLDGQVTNGGFIQFYFNGFEVYLPSLKKGLELIGYTDLLKKVIKSEKEYNKHIDKFNEWREKEDWEWLYDNLKEFDKLDVWYYSKEETHYSTLEKFVRNNIDDFIVKI